MGTAYYHGVEFRIESTDEGWSYRYKVESREKNGELSRTSELCAVRSVWTLIDLDLRRLSNVP
jgi:hypothetical protein